MGISLSSLLRSARAECLTGDERTGRLYWRLVRVHPVARVVLLGAAERLEVLLNFYAYTSVSGDHVFGLFLSPASREWYFAMQRTQFRALGEDFVV